MRRSMTGTRRRAMRIFCIRWRMIWGIEILRGCRSYMRIMRLIWFRFSVQRWRVISFICLWNNMSSTMKTSTEPNRTLSSRKTRRKLIKFSSMISAEYYATSQNFNTPGRRTDQSPSNSTSENSSFPRTSSTVRTSLNTSWTTSKPQKFKKC